MGKSQPILFFVGLFFGPVLFIFIAIELLLGGWLGVSGRYFDLLQSGWFVSGSLVSVLIIALIVVYFLVT